jgi:replication factor C subunit 1
MPFMKATNVVAPAKTTKEIPDLEEAIEESDDAEVIIEAPNDEDEDMDLSKDKYIKKPKAKKTAAPKKAAAKRSKAAKDTDDNDLEDDEDIKPKKRASKAKAPAAKGKTKK